MVSRRKTEVILFRWLLPHHFVLLMVTSAFLAFICSYAISVATLKVSPLFPYISDTGTKPPASCVFGLLLNISAGFGVLCVYLRHRHFEEYMLEHHRHHVINDVAMLNGILSCFGIMIVASFQWTEALKPHMIGAFMAFILGTVYCWLQSYLSYLTVGQTTTNLIFIVRLFLSACCTVSFIMTFAFAASTGKYPKDPLHWKRNEPGYYNHIGSTFSEWIMAICLLSFFITFYKEFKRIESKVKVNYEVPPIIA